MIETIDLVNFQSSAECRSQCQYSNEGFLRITYQFQSGNAYGVISDFGCGSWSLVTCLGGRGNTEYNGKILLNGAEIAPNELSVYSGFVTEKEISSKKSFENLLSARECIEKCLRISNLHYSVDEIKLIFHLSDERFERSLNNVSGEIWLISLAIQFALGKEIFCFPWLNMFDIKRFEILCELKIIEFLKSENKIILIPSSQKRVAKKCCDHVISLEKSKINPRNISWRK